MIGTPLGSLGGVIETAVEYGIAEASLDQFVSDVAAYLETAIDHSYQSL